MTLSAKLDEIRQGAMKKIPADKLAVMTQATADLRASGIVDNVIKIDAPLPAFTLTNMRGAQVSSAELLSRGALVLSVFRGHW
ncbi:MAG: hypothetical protein IPG43_03760 [Proteobacteria bacterium]|nr:hypothetical protein [Pseudomonadota bacterium]